AFSGFILIFPVLVLINTIVGQGIEIEDPQYKAYAEAISASNEYNFVKVINDTVQFEDKGLADWFFDLAFHSKVNDDEVITWRAELTWIGEGAKAALPYVVGGEQFNPETFTAEELGRFEGFFTAFAKSQLLNSILKPGIKLGIAFAPEFGVELPLTDSEIQTLMARLDATEISLTDDFNEIYLAVSELLQVQSFGQWQALGEDFGAIGNFTEDQQELFKSALSRIASLDLIKVGDIALEVGMYNQAVLDQITWIDST